MDLGLALWYRTPTMQRTRELFLFAPPSPTIMQSFTSQCRFALTSNLQTLCNNGTGFIKNTDCGVESAQVFVSEDYGVRDNKFSILLSTYSCYCWCSVASQRPSNWETATQSFRLYPLQRTLVQNSAPGVINEKRLLFTLNNECRGISWVS